MADTDYKPEDGDSNPQAVTDADTKSQGNFIGGHKATLRNPSTGEEAKENSRKVLEEQGVDVSK